MYRMATSRQLGLFPSGDNPHSSQSAELVFGWAEAESQGIVTVINYFERVRISASHLRENRIRERSNFG